MKRGTDHNWQVVRYIGDSALYARCKCGYRYICSSNTKNKDGTLSFKQTITILHHYCPNCGARKKWYNEEPIKLKELRW